jgi:hypothetical protein
MLDLAQVDLSLLADLLGHPDYGAGYLDPETGAVYPAFDGEVLGDDGDPVDPDDTGWIRIDGIGSHDAYGDMVDFASAVADPLVRRRLGEALDGGGAFRRFKRVVYNTPDEVGKVWNRFRDARAELRALDWLSSCELLAPDAAELARVERRARADGALAEAAGASEDRPTMTLINGLPGVGKSAAARRLAEASPGTLCLDIDEVRTLISGPFAASAERGRALGLAMAEHHLRSGHDVVVPQLVARVDQLERFEGVARAAGARFVHVILEDEAAAARCADRPPGDPRRCVESDLAHYRVGLAEIRRHRPEVGVVEASGRDLAAATDLVAWAARERGLEA